MANSQLTNISFQYLCYTRKDRIMSVIIKEEYNPRDKSGKVFTEMKQSRIVEYCNAVDPTFIVGEVLPGGFC